MKKYFLSIAVLALFSQKSNACSWYDPDYDYFNLFTQSIIKDKSYTPFLLTYSNWFYDENNLVMPDDNINAWQKYFGNTLSLVETSDLVNKISLNDLNNLKKGNPSHPLLKKLGFASYQKYKEGYDYLIEAKYLEPYMMISHVDNPDAFYYDSPENKKNATELQTDKTVTALKSLYNSVKNPEIKLRYGFQLVRFLHYNRDYEGAINAFKTHVEPIKLKTAPYYMALDQYAGALRGIGKKEDANWNFFQVFLNSNRKKQDAFVSMTLSDEKSFENLLKRATNDREKNMAYFLLGYQDFNNPLPMMEKMYEIDPKSEMLKVLAARAINELERNYLSTSYYSNGDTSSTQSTKTEESSSTTEKAPEKLSFWQRFLLFFKNLFSSKKSTETSTRTNDLSDKDYLNNPNRIPFLNNTEYSDPKEDETKKQYLENLEKFVEKTKEKNTDEYWQIVDAYLKFLNKDYEGSSDILKDIKTTNPEYLTQIERMNMLNDIVAQPKVDAAFEDHLMAKYKEFFIEKEIPKDSTNNFDYSSSEPNTSDFLKDILANRYFLQGEDAKSYLMSNKLSDIRYNPNYDLTKKLDVFYNKKGKTTFEQQIIEKNIDNVGDPNSFFNLVYGDNAMRTGDFENAKKFYSKSSNFKGYDLPTETWNYSTSQYDKITNTDALYNGYKNISDKVFGHAVWESYQSPADQSMKSDDFVSEFSFIKPVMNKLELAENVIQLKKLGAGKGETASKANQLIGNLLYNTSILGYYREMFVMDVDNSNGGKYYFSGENSPFKYYYKNYSNNVFIKPNDFNLSINYYQKALQQTTDKEKQARILFQMASAEQGKYYQWEAKQKTIDWNDKDWETKRNKQEIDFAATKNQKYRTYFTELKNKYSDTETSKSLMGSCSYYDYFMKK